MFDFATVEVPIVSSGLDFGNEDAWVKIFLPRDSTRRVPAGLNQSFLFHPLKARLYLRCPRVHASVRRRRGCRQHDAGSMQFRCAHLVGVLDRCRHHPRQFGVLNHAGKPASSRLIGRDPKGDRGGTHLTLDQDEARWKMGRGECPIAVQKSGPAARLRLAALSWSTESLGRALATTCCRS